MGRYIGRNPKILEVESLLRDGMWYHIKSIFRKSVCMWCPLTGTLITRFSNFYRYTVPYRTQCRNSVSIFTFFHDLMKSIMSSGDLFFYNVVTFVPGDGVFNIYTFRNQFI